MLVSGTSLVCAWAGDAGIVLSLLLTGSALALFVVPRVDVAKGLVVRGVLETLLGFAAAVVVGLDTDFDGLAALARPKLDR